MINNVEKQLWGQFGNAIINAALKPGAVDVLYSRKLEPEGYGESAYDDDDGVAEYHGQRRVFDP